MGFMQLSTQSGAWVTFEADRGESHVTWLRHAVMNDVAGGLELAWAHEASRPNVQASIKQALEEGLGYSNVSLDSIEIVFGFCSRYSADGYMDCTDWCGPYASAYAAEKSAKDMYGDDND